jgi:membrane fusion protein (multidrug efflux system)
MSESSHRPARYGLGRRLLRVLLLAVVPLVLVAGALGWYARGGRIAETENAYVKAHIIAITPEVSGRVLEVTVRDQDTVVQGATLFRIDPAPFELEIRRAEAQMAVARTEVEALRADYRVALAEAQEVEARIDFLEKQLDRQAKLKAQGMIRDEAYDEARLNVQAAKQKLGALREQAARVRANLGGDPQRPVETHPRFRQARAARDAAQLDLEHSTIVAPAAGTVNNMRLQAGEYVTRGSPVFSVVEDGPVWVEANFKETQLAGLREGQPATVVADAYPGREWRATVKAIAPATGAEFALLPPQNATGNWVKIVQRVPVLLTLEPQPLDGAVLRAGMTVTVSIDTGHSRGLPRPLRALVENLR